MSGSLAVSFEYKLAPFNYVSHTGKGPRPTTIRGPLTMLIEYAGGCRAWDFCVSILMLLATWAGVIAVKTGTTKAASAIVVSARKDTISREVSEVTEAQR